MGETAEQDMTGADAQPYDPVAGSDYSHIPREHFVFDAEYVRDHFFHNDDMIRVKQAIHNGHRTNPETIIDHLLRCLSLTGREAVLDLGCGNGFILREIVLRLRQGGRAVGLDIAPGVLEEAQRKLSVSWVPVEWVEGSADDLSAFPDRAFDRVMANYMMHYVPDLDRCFEEIRRVLTPRGHFVLTTDSVVSMNEMYRVHFDALRRLDFPERLFKATPKGRISLDAGRPLLEKYFDLVEKRIYPDTLVFESSAPFMEFYTVGHNYCCAASVAADDLTPAMFSALYSEVEAQVAAIIEREGRFEVTKVTGSFICWP